MLALRWPVRRRFLNRTGQTEPECVSTAAVALAGNVTDEDLVRAERMTMRAVRRSQRHVLASTPHKISRLSHGRTVVTAADRVRLADSAWQSKQRHTLPVAINLITSAIHQITATIATICHIAPRVVGISNRAVNVSVNPIFARTKFA